MLSSLTPGQFREIIGLLIALAIVLVALIAVQLTGDGDPSAADATTTLATTLPPTTEASTTTAEAPTTTSPTTTTEASTTTEATTTTGAETTTTEATTTTVAATTTLPPAAGIVLGSDGLGVVAFGTSPEDTTAILTAELGAGPDVDTGWIDAFDNPYGTCPPPEVRGIEWGMLVTVHTRAETDFASAGTEHFFSYTYAPQPSKPGAGPHGLETAEGIGLGSSRTQLLAAYGDRVQIFDDDVFGTFFQIDLDFDTDAALGGNMTGPDDIDQVSSFLGGEGCGE